MIGLPSLANPWVILGLVVALGGAAGAGYVRGHGDGARGVQADWDKQTSRAALLASENAQRSRDTEQQLQEAQDAERKQNAKALEDMDARLAAAGRELQRRPARPAAGLAGAQAAGPGADGRGTGAGLYRDDALLLAGKADLWQRIRLQRDACYRAYDKAGEALAELNRRLAERATASP